MNNSSATSLKCLCTHLGYVIINETLLNIPLRITEKKRGFETIRFSIDSQPTFTCSKLTFAIMLYSLLSRLSRCFGTFICLLEWLLEEPLRSVQICTYHL